jgi:4-alpha-glucanotransferase
LFFGENRPFRHEVMRFAIAPAIGRTRPARTSFSPAHCVANSGTHDNTTLDDWLSQTK